MWLSLFSLSAYPGSSRRVEFASIGAISQDNLLSRPHFMHCVVGVVGSEERPNEQGVIYNVNTLFQLYLVFLRMAVTVCTAFSVRKKLSTLHICCSNLLH